MKIGVFLFVVGAVVAAAAFDDVLPREGPWEVMEVLTLDSESHMQSEMPEEDTLFRKEGCSSSGWACRRRKGTCIPTSNSCNGTKINKGCGNNCTCCIMATERCEAKKTCKDANGFCVKGSRNCTGSIISQGCTGKDCICCVNDKNCPNGFYRVGTECFKVIHKLAEWDKARQLCQDHGWQLAEPEDLRALAEFIYTNVSDYYFWIGARGVGGSFKYLSGQSVQADRKWPSDMSSVGDCLILRSPNTSYTTNTSFTSTLISKDCNFKYHFICEPGCPKGFFRSGSGCFKLFVKQGLKWEDAEKNCHAEGLQIAEPEDPKTLAKKIYDGLGGTHVRYSTRFWLGARGGRLNGSTIAWNSGDAVPNPHPINNTWHSNYPRYNTSSYCLQIYTGYYNRGPMYEYNCAYGFYSVCEMICPMGFFKIGKRCYKAYSGSTSSWTQAHEMCNKVHLTLAEPHDPTAVADYLYTVAGHRNYWLGGRGNGSKFLWSSGEVIPSNWTPWKTGNPGNNVGTDYCLELSPDDRSTPLISTTCSKLLYPLCQ